MNIITLLNAMRDAVADDADTKTWCQAQYGSDHQVLVGLDRRRPPEAESDYPLVHLYPGMETEGYELEEETVVINASCGIYDTANLSGLSDNITQMQGIGNVVAFRGYVRAAIAGASLGSVFIHRIESLYDTVEFYPAFIVTLRITIGAPYSLGGDPFP